MGWHVGLLYNSKDSLKTDAQAPADALAEYDSPETVRAIANALRAGGHRVTPLQADETLLDTLRDTQPDICFNIAEGLRGDARESHAPALMEMLGIPYTGSGVLTHAISLDKAMAKHIWRDNGLPTAPFQVLRAGDEPLDPTLIFPLFVKPLREGSGMGISERSIVYNEASLREQAGWVIRTYRQPALVETYLPGREFTVGIIGNTLQSGERRREASGIHYDPRGFHVFPIQEIDTSRGASQGVYNTLAKTFGPSDQGAPGLTCPADISHALTHEIQSLTIDAFEAIETLDVARVDFRLGRDGSPYIIEINTLPGMRPSFSDLCLAAEAEGIDHATLVNEILALALARYGMERANTTLREK
jgi:D-alanine-D-alanine ligase